MIDRSVELVAPDRVLLERLLPVARHIFTATFAGLYDRADFERFCDDIYRPGGTMSHDFDDPQVHWRVATTVQEPIGYAKLTPLRAPFPDPRAGSVELQQIYVLPEWHGTGVAAQLMEWGMATARALGAPDIYLTVFDHNVRAKRFYTRYGFSEVGRRTFKLGNRTDDDRIWRARLGD